MKVLHIVSAIDPRAGGPAVALVGLAAAQKKLGLDVSVVATWIDGENADAAQRLRALGIPVELIGPCAVRMRRHPQIIPALQHRVPAADVVHIHALWEEVHHQAAVIARASSKPYIFRPCGMLDPWSLNQGRLKKKLYLALRLKRDLNRATAIHFTADLERDLTKPLRIKSPAIVEPNGIALDEFRNLPRPGTFRSLHPEIGERAIVLFLSRAHPKKGLDLLVPAFAKARATRGNKDDVFLVIAGPDDGGHVAQIEAMARTHSIGERTIFTGMLQGVDRVAALVDSTFFVLPSYQENFGIAAVEAMAAGRGVIISDQVNIFREVAQSASGVVVRTDVDELATAIARWLDDPASARAAGEKARAFAFAQYDWEEIARRWEGHYARLSRQT